MNITFPDKVFSEAEVIELYNNSYPKWKIKPKQSTRKPRATNAAFPAFTRRTPDGYYVAMDGDILAGWCGWVEITDNIYLTAGSLTFPDYKRKGIQEILWPKRDIVFGGSAVIAITNNSQPKWVNFVGRFYPKATVDLLPDNIQTQVQEALDFYEEKGKSPNIFYKGPTEDSAMQKAWSIIKADVDFKLLIPDYIQSRTTGGIYDRRTGNIEIYPSSVYKYLKAKLQRTPKDEELQKFVVALINHEAGHAADYSVNPHLDMFWDEQQVDASREWVAFQSQHPKDPYLAMVGFLKHPYTFKLVGPRGQPATGVDYIANNVTQEHHPGLPTSIKNIVAYVNKHAKTPKQKNKLAALELSQRGRKKGNFPTNVLGAERRYGKQHLKFLKTLRW